MQKGNIVLSPAAMYPAEPEFVVEAREMHVQGLAVSVYPLSTPGICGLGDARWSPPLLLLEHLFFSPHPHHHSTWSLFFLGGAPKCTPPPPLAAPRLLSSLCKLGQEF